jgi:4-hydroxy-tetrahydrodipicolinate reductase
MTVRVAVVGATGRMGGLVTEIVEATDGLELVAGLSSRDDLAQLAGADLVVDVTVPAVSPGIVTAALEAGADVLVGTSGWSEERIADVRRFLGEAPTQGVVFVPNFAVGSVLATAFAAKAAKWFESIEIIEAHHAGKVDSPSGTAVRTAELIAAARRDVGPVEAPHVDQRARGQQVASVPVHSLRMRGVVARQEVWLGGAGETLTIAHDTISHDAYRHGIALALAKTPGTRGVLVGLDALMELD